MIGNLCIPDHWSYRGFKIERLCDEEGQFYVEICDLSTSCMCAEHGPFPDLCGAKGWAEQWVDAWTGEDPSTWK